MLKEASQARTYSLKLQGMEFADDLASQMMSHAEQLEKLYNEIKTKTAKDAPTPKTSWFDGIFEKHDNIQKWFTNAEARAFLL